MTAHRVKMKTTIKMMRSLDFIDPTLIQSLNTLLLLSLVYSQLIPSTPKKSSKDINSIVRV